jgi:hypothetical protein
MFCTIQTKEQFGSDLPFKPDMSARLPTGTELMLLFEAAGPETELALVSRSRNGAVVGLGFWADYRGAREAVVLFDEKMTREQRVTIRRLLRSNL